MRLRGMDQAEAERQNVQSRLNYMCPNPTTPQNDALRGSWLRIRHALVE